MKALLLVVLIVLVRWLIVIGIGGVINRHAQFVSSVVGLFVVLVILWVVFLRVLS